MKPYESMPYCVLPLSVFAMLQYRIAGKFGGGGGGGGKFGELGKSSVIRKTKTIQIFTYNYYLMAESIHSPNFSSPNAHNSEIRQLSRHQTFPLYYHSM